MTEAAAGAGSVSVVMAAFNEADRMGPILDRSLARVAEWIAVDDAILAATVDWYLEHSAVDMLQRSITVVIIQSIILEII